MAVLNGYQRLEILEQLDMIIDPVRTIGCINADYDDKKLNLLIDEFENTFMKLCLYVVVPDGIENDNEK